MVVVWAASLLIRLSKKEYVSAGEQVAFIFCMGSILAYLRTNGSYRYIFPYQVIALIFFPFSLSYVFEWASGIIPRFSSQVLKSIPIIVFSALMLLGFYQILFNSWAADFYSSHKTAFWERYFTELPANQSVFFYDTPEVALFDKSTNYYQYLAPAGWTSDTHELQAIRTGAVDTVIISTAVFSSQPDLFGKYVVAEESYKYSILKRK